MNLQSSFIAPFAKVARSKAQIQELDIAIKNFFDVTPYEVVRQLDVEADEEVWGFRLSRGIPHDLSVRVGEIFHNLRSALDQMVAEVVVRVANRSESRVEFPFGKDFGEFEAALLKQKKIPPDAVVMIRTLRPYGGGDPLLWLLHSTNRRDKHRMGLVPIQSHQGKVVRYLVLWYGSALVIGSRSGQHLANAKRFSNEDYLRLAAKGQTWGAYGTMVIDPGTGDPMDPVLGPIITSDMGVFGDIEKGMEFLTVTPGTKFKTDFHPSFDMALRDAGGLEREPIALILSSLRDLVERILLAFEGRFFP